VLSFAETGSSFAIPFDIPLVFAGWREFVEVVFLPLVQNRIVENYNHIPDEYAVDIVNSRHEYIALFWFVPHPHISFFFLRLVPINSTALFGGFLQISDELQCLVLPFGNEVEPSKMDFVDIGIV